MRNAPPDLFHDLAKKKTPVPSIIAVPLRACKLLRNPQIETWLVVSWRYMKATYGRPSKWGAYLLLALSLTRSLADYLKHVVPEYLLLQRGSGTKTDDESRKHWKRIVLEDMNFLYRAASVVLMVLAGYLWSGLVGDAEHPRASPWGVLVLLYYALSRANEVFYAFTTDAIRIAKGEDPTSGLRRGGRIKLALWSYFSLILDFAIIYYLFRHGFTAVEEHGAKVYRLSTIWDAVYFSGVTMTTLGYGDISPTTWFTKLVILYQVACGIALFVLSIAIYAGSDPENPSKRPDEHAPPKESSS